MKRKLLLLLLFSLFLCVSCTEDLPPWKIYPQEIDAHMEFYASPPIETDGIDKFRMRLKFTFVNNGDEPIDGHYHMEGTFFVLFTATGDTLEADFLRSNERFYKVMRPQEPFYTTYGWNMTFNDGTLLLDRCGELGGGVKIWSEVQLFRLYNYIRTNDLNYTF